MSILSDKDIKHWLSRGLVIEPMDMSLDPIQPASCDLRLGAIGESDPAFDGWESYHLRPGGFILASTLETVRIPDSLVAQVNGKSTLGRLGLFVHVTAGFLDPGFHGQITLELFNASSEAVVLRPRQFICQLVLQKLLSPAERPYGHPTRKSKYQSQRGVTKSR